MNYIYKLSPRKQLAVGAVLVGGAYLLFKVYQRIRRSGSKKGDSEFPIDAEDNLEVELTLSPSVVYEEGVWTPSTTLMIIKEVEELLKPEYAEKLKIYNERRRAHLDNHKLYCNLFL